MKALKWYVVSILLFFFFLFMVIGVFDNNERKNSYGNGVCEYTITVTENEKIESKRKYVDSKVVDIELTNVILGIYAVEEYKELDNIINTINKNYVYVTEKDKTINELSYIQSYKWGVAYIDILLSKNENSSITLNKEYEQGLGVEELKDYKYYMSVLTAINTRCSSTTDGLPLLKPYTITGWFPNYAQDGTGDKHYGIDFGVPIGTDIFTVNDGEVLASYNECAINDGYIGNICGKEVGYDGSGNFVFIKSNNDGVDYYIMYCHMKDISVHKGDEVYKGQKVGTSGNSGNSTGAHLHFEVRKNAKVGSDDGVINPCEYVEGLCE